MIASVCDGNGGGGETGSAAAAEQERGPHAWAAAVQARRGRQRAEREARIDQLVAHATESKEGPSDRAYWSLVYDLELAPMTTNRQQLAELGITAPGIAELTDEEVSTRLRMIIDGLADLFTYLIHTDHLSDRELYERLVTSVLDEPVHEICDGSGGREFIDLAAGSSPGDRDGWLSIYASDEERSGASEQGERVPERRSPPFERDRTLPRPD